MTGVVFDFGNVLYRVDYPGMAEALVGQERAPDFLSGFVDTPLQTRYETGAATLDDVLGALRLRGFGVARERFLEAYLAVFSPVPGVRRILERLADRRRLGLLSNTSPEHAHLFIERTPEFALFDRRVYSFELGCMKPNPRMFRAILEQMRLPARSVAYVDDVTEYVLASSRLGLTGIRFRGGGELVGELLELGFCELRGGTVTG